jgi:hypothetical protein
MKISKLLQLLMLSANLFRVGIVPEGGGGDDAAAAAEAEAAAAAEAEAAAAAAAAGGDGKPKVSDAEAKLLKEVMQKKDALKTASDALTAANDKLKAFEGIDPVKVRELLAQQSAAENAQLEAKGEYERVKQRMAEEHATTLRGRDDLIAQLQAQLAGKDGTINELTVGQQFAHSKFITEESTMAPAKARKLFGEHFDMVDGKVTPYDKPRGEANRTTLVDQFGNSLPFEEAMRKIVEADPDRDSLLRSKVKPGANSDSKAKPVDAKINTAETDSISKISAGLKGLKLG